jgi:hypothetical protein
MAGAITVAVMAGDITVAEVITMAGAEVITTDGVIIVAGAIVVGSSGNYSDRSQTQRNGTGRRGKPWRLLRIRQLGSNEKAARLRRLAPDCYPVRYPGTVLKSAFCLST